MATPKKRLRSKTPADQEQALKSYVTQLEEMNDELRKRIVTLRDELEKSAVRVDVSGPPRNRHYNFVTMDDPVPSAVETNAAGGMQSRIGVRHDLLDGTAMTRLGRVLHKATLSKKAGGSGYPPNNWRKISRGSHINHAIEHFMNVLAAYETQRTAAVMESCTAMKIEEEMDHALCRAMMAVATPWDYSEYSDGPAGKV